MSSENYKKLMNKRTKLDDSYADNNIKIKHLSNNNNIDTKMNNFDNVKANTKLNSNMNDFVNNHKENYNNLKFAEAGATSHFPESYDTAPHIRLGVLSLSAGDQVKIGVPTETGDPEKNIFTLAHDIDIPVVCRKLVDDKTELTVENTKVVMFATGEDGDLIRYELKSDIDYRIADKNLSYDFDVPRDEFSITRKSNADNVTYFEPIKTYQKERVKEYDNSELSKLMRMREVTEFTSKNVDYEPDF